MEENEIRTLKRRNLISNVEIQFCRTDEAKAGIYVKAIQGTKTVSNMGKQGIQ
jgi:hypothetical protein